MNKSNLSKDERTKLMAILAELGKRGQSLPEDLASSVLGNETSIKWLTDENEFFYRKDARQFRPYPSQRDFVLSRSVYSGFKGSRGSGKSSAGAQKALHKIMLGQPGAVVNPDFENFKISTWPEFREWIPWNHVVAKHRHRQNIDWIPDRPFVLAFDTGSYVFCKGLKDADSARGPNINWLWYDEAQRDPDGIAWKYATASVRVGQDPQSWATYTPNGTLHWTYKFFTLQTMPQEVIDLFNESNDSGRPLIEVFHGTMEDNKDNLDPSFYASMRAMYAGSGWLERQEIFGEDVAQEGALGGTVAEFLEKNTLEECPPVTSRVRYWDMAATEKKIISGRVLNDPDECVGTLMSYNKETGLFYIEHQECGFWEWDDLKKHIRDVTEQDGPAVKVIIEQEPASGGKNQVAGVKEYLNQELRWPDVEGWLPKNVGDRVMGANYWFAESKIDKVFLINDGSWDVKGLLEQIRNFPIVRHDDRVTSVTGARCNLAPIKKWKSVQFLHV